MFGRGQDKLCKSSPFLETKHLEAHIEVVSLVLHIEEVSLVLPIEVVSLELPIEVVREATRKKKLLPFGHFPNGGGGGGPTQIKEF